MWLGYAVMAACGTAAVSGAVIGAVMLLNLAAWRLLEMYGGFKTFLEFREWYWAQPENKDRSKSGIKHGAK